MAEETPLLATSNHGQTAQSSAVSSPMPSRRASFGLFLDRFWPLGLIAFGGPTAHVGLMHEKFVKTDTEPKLPNDTFLELFALTAALPGPGSTQLATALGATFGGLWGALITFFVWQIPGALAMTFAGIWFHSHLDSATSTGLVSRVADYSVGLISAAFTMVVIAAYNITTKSCAGSRLKATICVLTAAVAVLIPPKEASWAFVLMLFLGGTAVLLQSIFLPDDVTRSQADRRVLQDWHANIKQNTGGMLLLTFAIATGAVLFWRPSSLEGRILQSFWRIGATVVGGGQVVIPMILNDVVESGWLPDAVFLTGFGLVGCAPGPMFNLAAFLGGAMASWTGALFAMVGLFMPGIILILAMLPFWEEMRESKSFSTFLSGVQVAAAGLILSGVWMLMHRALVGPLAFALCLIAAVATTSYGLKSPVVIPLCGVLGAVFVGLEIGGPYH